MTVVDQLTKARRSWNMSRIRSTDTRPERAVRALLQSLGYRPQLHRRDLPGIPDLVLPRRKVALFVHGCFWHRHPRCRYSYSPRTNRQFWNTKFHTNVLRDRRVRRGLTRLGWQTVVVWECELRVPDRLRLRITRILKIPRRKSVR
jgi:DNA mismatch endonuclease (patch repair protein)